MDNRTEPMMVAMVVMAVAMALTSAAVHASETRWTAIGDNPHHALDCYDCARIISGVASDTPLEPMPPLRIITKDGGGITISPGGKLCGPATVYADGKPAFEIDAGKCFE